MFLKHLEPIFKPWRAARNKVVKVKTTKGNVKAETSRVARFGKVAKKEAGKAGKVAGMKMKKPELGGAKMPPFGQPPAMPGAAPPGAPAGNGAASPAQAPADFVPNPPIAIKGWFFRKKYCTQCLQRLDMSWDACPYCLQAYQQQQAAPSAPAKTQAFMIGQSINGGSEDSKPCWLVGLKGPQRGELFTIQGPGNHTIGTAVTSTVVLHGTYISGQHMEVFRREGMWILRDLGSSNGTYVNDQRIMEHDLFDNDIITLGDCMYKFKEL